MARRLTDHQYALLHAISKSATILWRDAKAATVLRSLFRRGLIERIRHRCPHCHRFNDYTKWPKTRGSWRLTPKGFDAVSYPDFDF